MSGANLYECEPGLLLRTGEIELLARFDAEGHVEAAKTMRKLGAQRYGHQLDALERGADWREAYQQACNAIERLLSSEERAQKAREFANSAGQRTREEIALRKEAWWRMKTAETAVEQLEEELVRVREERDDALSRAADSFAMGRRSAA